MSGEQGCNWWLAVLRPGRRVLRRVSTASTTTMAVTIGDTYVASMNEDAELETHGDGRPEICASHGDFFSPRIDPSGRER